MRPGRAQRSEPAKLAAEAAEENQGVAVAVTDAEEAPPLLRDGVPGSAYNFDEIVRVNPVCHFLFRRRTFVVLVSLLIMAALARPTPVMLSIGVALAVLAEAWRIWASGTIHKTEEVTTGGPYAYVRHPLYVGSFLHAVAYCFMSGLWPSFLIVVPLFCLLYGVAVFVEERMLLRLFGEEYAAYSRQVPRFVPKPLAARPPRTGGEFNWRQAMWNKEYVNVIWLVFLSGLFLARLVLHR